MSSRLITSENAKNILKDIQARSGLRPNILARIAINLSINEDTSINNKDYDRNGLEFHRHVLLGDYDQLFKALISQHLNRNISEEKFFPDYIQIFLEEGVKILKREYDYAGNYKTFIKNITMNKLE